MEKSLRGKMQRGSRSFSVRRRHRLRESVLFFDNLNSLRELPYVYYLRTPEKHNNLNKVTELYASKCELNVLLLVAAEPPVV